MPDALAQLAAATEPCDCGWCDPVDEEHNPGCSVCNGSGRVAAIPGLRVPCDETYDHGCTGPGCLNCDGLGYTVLDEAEAVLVVEEWLLRSEWPDGDGRTLQFGFDEDRVYCGIGPAANAVEATGETVADALFAAVVQLGLKVKA